MITLTTISYEKKQGTKTVYTETEREQKEITTEQYDNITAAETLRFFRRLGGSETAVKGYTSAGYKTIQLTSTSPDKEVKTVRKFKFD